MSQTLWQIGPVLPQILLQVMMMATMLSALLVILSEMMTLHRFSHVLLYHDVAPVWACFMYVLYCPIVGLNVCVYGRCLLVGPIFIFLISAFCRL